MNKQKDNDKPHKPPMQPIYIYHPEKSGGRLGVHLRFQQNKIVRDLLDFAGKHGMDMNTICMGEYSEDDHEQFAQLIGYSLSGFSELHYSSTEVVEAAWAMGSAIENGDETLTEEEAKLEHQREIIAKVKKSINEIVPLLWRVADNELDEIDGA